LFIRQPSLTWILDTTPELLARIFEKGDPLLEQVAENIICLAAPDTFTASSDQPTDIVGALDIWRSFIVDLLSLRASRGEFLLQLSAEAAEGFQQFRWKKVSLIAPLGSDSPRFSRGVLTNAAKLALCAALFQNRPPRLPGSIMAKTIAFAQRLAADTDRLAAALDKEGQRLALEKKATKMLEVLAQIGRSTPYELRRHFDHQSKQIHTLVLDYLIAKGRVRPHPDGTVEAIEGSELVKGKNSA
jgi:hypothetical protein